MVSPKATEVTRAMAFEAEVCVTEEKKSGARSGIGRWRKVPENISKRL